MIGDDTPYLHSGGVLAEIDASGAATFHLTEGLGSVRGLADATRSGTGANDNAMLRSVMGNTGRP